MSCNSGERASLLGSTIRLPAGLRLLRPQVYSARLPCPTQFHHSTLGARKTLSGQAGGCLWLCELRGPPACSELQFQLQDWGRVLGFA